ncbi:MAG TPA: cobalt ECF transporter T component CbiQ [Chloroflexia bacterium]|nr:cobalt ECF transporter T component CbiQ [Chloroflexia bacterium]
MHIHFLDPYRPGASPIHALDPRVKLVLALAFILTTSLTPVGAWPIYILLFSISLSLVILSELGIGSVLKRANLALPFVLAALPLVFTAGAPILFVIPLGFGTLEVSQEGVIRFASITFKSWVSVQIAIVLAATTRFPELLTAMRALKVPRLLVAIFGLMWRYLFVLADEAMRLMRARAARSGHPPTPGAKVGGTIPWRARVTGGMAGNLFLRSFERGDRIYAAMSARGYDGEIRTFPLPKLAASHIIVLALGLLLLLSLLALSLMFT